MRTIRKILFGITFVVGIVVTMMLVLLEAQTAAYIVAGSYIVGLATIAIKIYSHEN
jgi:hypothetical protein